LVKVGVDVLCIEHGARAFGRRAREHRKRCVATSPTYN
jgi:hypothetical protein